MIHEIWCTIFSVTLPPENSQKSRQLMYLKPSNLGSFRPSKNSFQFTWSGLQSEGTGRTHCPLPIGVLRLIHASTLHTLPTLPSFIQRSASFSSPELSCCSPIWMTCFDAAAAFLHSTAPGMSHVIVFSEYKSFPACNAATKYFVCRCSG